MCERVVSAAEYTNQQDNGLWRVWGYVPELDRYIRVITSAAWRWKGFRSESHPLPGRNAKPSDSDQPSAFP